MANERVPLRNTNSARWVENSRMVALQRDHVPDDRYDTVYITKEEYDQIGEIFEENDG